MIPEKPTTSAVIRRMRIRSPRMNMASTVAINGPVNSRATTLASGVSLSA